MIILIVEDKKDEIEKAKKAVLERKAKPVVATTLEDVTRLMSSLGGAIDGILTDLHFPEYEKSTAANPSGLAVVIRAIRMKIPVSICSDVNHHFAKFLTEVIDGLKELTGKDIPFTLDSKDWNRAMQDLVSEMKKQQ